MKKIFKKVSKARAVVFARPRSGFCGNGFSYELTLECGHVLYGDGSKGVPNKKYCMHCTRKHMETRGKVVE